MAPPAKKHKSHPPKRGFRELSCDCVQPVITADGVTRDIITTLPPLKSLWDDKTAQEYIAKYAYLPQNAEDMALRVYTSHLIGGDQRLVLHGGGNTSVKLSIKTVDGAYKQVVAVKGSGWDLSSIEPQGFPQVDMAALLPLRALEKLSDEDMVNRVKGNMQDITSPSPSIETLLHAFLPHKWIDHTHADAAVAIMDQPDAVNIVKRVYGDRVAILPYIQPGLGLAQACIKAYEANPHVEALMLLKHGVFTFADNAREAYETHISIIAEAEKFLLQHKNKPLHISAPASTLDGAQAEAVFRRLAPALRGVLHNRSGHSWLVSRRTSEASIAFASSVEAKEWSQLGPLTPDHVIRTKGFPMLVQDIPQVSSDSKENLKAMIAHVEKCLDVYITKYEDYFNNYNQVFESQGKSKKKLDSFPRVVLVEGVGIVAVSRTVKANRIAADIYEHTIPNIIAAQTVGQYQPPSGQHLFDIEYWSLEQAKLGKVKPAVLQGAIAYITGGASGIGLSTALAMGKAGAAVVITDINQSTLDTAVAQLRAAKVEVTGMVVDVTDPATVSASFERVISTYGGIDIIVSNAGRPPASVLMSECEPSLLKAQFELNFFAHQYVASAAVRVMLKQGSGGCLLFNASKAALNPGAKIGPYATSKAAVLSLMKQYALEHGPDGIRSNAVNADRVRTALFSEEVITARAAARNTTPTEYFKLNLLKQEVTSDHVGKAFTDLALSPSTTGAILTVDGGNIAASVR